ncbi:MAG: biotin/lipoyl-binding protein [FCB group bacterium]|nr:biotin/lipoyl-binding protein [FCB group bacterium]
MKKRAGIEDGDKEKRLIAPMPGLIVGINCQAGQSAKRGEPLLIMEAMKMENDIKSPVAGKVKNIAVEVGQIVDKGQLLVEFE